MENSRNIVLLTVDSLRADFCGFTGGNDGYTPAMDRLADDGLVFENAIAPGPATADSMPVVFSGDFYPRPEDDWSPFEEPAVIRDHMRARETIPERLSRQGYETAAFTTNPWTSRRYGFDDGFDHFEDFIGATDSEDDESAGVLERLLTDENGNPAMKPLKLLLDWRRQNDMFQSWDTFYEDVVQWTDEAEEPYFLWIFLVDAHMPFLPPDEFRSQSRLGMLASNFWLYLDDRRFESVFGERLRAAYADTVQYVDDRVERLTNDLAGDDPLLVIHGDHGEEFGERGEYGHGQNLSEDLIRVPLLVSNGPTGRVTQPFSLADMPNLLQRLADGQELQDERGFGDLGAPVVQSRNLDPKMAVRGENWKYVESETERQLLRIGGDGSEREAHNPELLRLGHDVVTRWDTVETERREIVRAAREMASSEEV